MSAKKILVKIFYLKDKPIAEHINKTNGKPSYFDASKIIKQVAPNSNNLYKVIVKNGKCTKVTSQIHKKRKISNKTLKALEKIK